ncbi:peroxiredoxin Q, chloroplastic-like [Lactuca sativa]|uniref:peroxiredoxin Q, chloroplastic-like n=1 Tax=Lactuca sativa TaxID=4236 RepID=UPI000CD978D1|nr:peroxiredoxin Q, chloroplastic-like [Lactuca sativa]
MIESNNSGTASSSPRQRLSALMSAEASSSSSSSSEIKFQNSSSIQTNSMASPSNVNMGLLERSLSAVGAAFLSAIIVNPLDVAKVNKGSIPPSFTLKDQDGKTVSLSKFKGKPLVVYFYPTDETPRCTKQACGFRDSYKKFKKAGAQVIRISGDDAESHKAFAKKYRLPFTLLSDEGNKARKEWGVPSDLFGTLPGSQNFFFDKSYIVRLVYG